jgi:serine/threonine-protein kinase
MTKEARDSDAITTIDSHARARISTVTPVALPTERFTDEGEIAKGGASAVHRIFDRTLLRRSAMKVLAAGLQPFPEDRQRFIQEAQITAQLDHPNVVPIHELGLTSSGAPYFTMKLVEGETMETLLAERQGEVRQVGWVAALLEILIKVCDAVAFAHSRGVIHRDLKPGNIMVGAFGQVYVMDWGIAKLVDGKSDVSVDGKPQGTLDRHGMILGTPAYMPPEQARGHHCDTDERSDIFALGATLYHILTGQAPHEGGEAGGELDAARRGDIRPPEQFPAAARLPRSLFRIAMRAMATDRRDRYRTASELKDDLFAQVRGGADLPRRNFAAGELVMREGDPGEAAYIIVSGTCRAFKTVDGEEVELRRMGPGEVFGETAILSAKPRTASVQALEPLAVRVVTPDELEEGVGMNTWVGQFVRTLAERFREVDERLTIVEAMMSRKPPERL